MMKPSRRSLRCAVIVFAFLLTAYLLRFASYPDRPVLKVVLGMVRSVIYTGVIVFWGISVRRRIVHTQVKRLFTAISVLMVYWMTVRTIKFYFAYSPDLRRYLWYFYYVAMIFIPLFAFLTAMWLGRAEDYHLPAWTKLLYPVAFALVLLVLGNDLHQWVFRFPEGAWGYSDSDAGYAPLAYPVFAWRIAGLLITVCVIFARSHVPQSRKRAILPLVPATTLLIYGILYVAGAPVQGGMIEDVTVMECLHVVAILEACLQCGLIQSNIYYAELFQKLGNPAVITDEDYTPVYRTDISVPLSEEQMRSAQKGAVELQEGLLLKNMPLKTGHILWTEDTAELTALQREAEALTKELEEEKDLLSAEIEIKQKQAVLDTRNRLYDTVVHELSPQFEEIDRLVSADYQSEEERKSALRRMCVICAYIKRRCNLLFLKEEHERVSTDELMHCLRESVDYIRLCGAQCELHEGHSGMIPIEHAILAYDLFERVTQEVLETLRAMLIYFQVKEGELTFRIQSECGAEQVALSDMETAVRQNHGSMTYEREDGILYFRLSLSERRESV